ncbi:MAG: RpoL/Rpb11 RNA polymerase subunit family protein [Thermoprotei archaeon]
MYELKVLRKSDNEILLEIRGEDHTLGNLLVKEALRHPKVEYAAYRIPHPLQDRMEIYIATTKDANIKDIIREVIDSIRKYLNEFKNEVVSKLGEA